MPPISAVFPHVEILVASDLLHTSERFVPHWGSSASQHSKQTVASHLSLHRAHTLPSKRSSPFQLPAPAPTTATACLPLPVEGLNLSHLTIKRWLWHPAIEFNLKEKSCCTIIGNKYLVLMRSFTKKPAQVLFIYCKEEKHKPAACR